ncbi:hypothetical protein EMIT0P12_10943 [Pseudomonas sp. IT-P12]
MMCCYAYRTTVPASPRRTCPNCSTLSSPPNQRVWAWACRSAARSSRPMADASGLKANRDRGHGCVSRFLARQAENPLNQSAPLDCPPRNNGKSLTWTALTYFRFNEEGKVIEEIVERNELFMAKQLGIISYE